MQGGQAECPLVPLDQCQHASQRRVRAVLCSTRLNVYNDRLLDWRWGGFVPLHVRHNTNTPPIGVVEDLRKSKDGQRLLGVLRFAPRVDWHLQRTRAGLFGVSIAPQALAPGTRNRWGGHDYPLVRVREVSLVDQAANGDAHVVGEIKTAEDFLDFADARDLRQLAGYVTQELVARRQEIALQVVREIRMRTTGLVD
jgi:hypothetical protein